MSESASEESPRARAYYLRRHIYYYASSDGIIFMDLKRGKYFGLDSDDAALVGPLIAGWPESDADQANCNESGVAVAEHLVETGILTTSKNQGKSAQTPSIAFTDEIRFHDEPSRRRIALGDLIRLFVALARAKLRLGIQPFERVVQAVEKRKTRNALGACRDDERIRERVIAFHKLRPLILSAHDACLLDSLFLVEFLSQYDIYPDWIIAVGTRPFMAHSWVQHEGTILNDSLERVNGLHPLISI